MYDSTRTIADFLTAAAAKQPSPGGGSVTALVGALAASMGEMVVQYSVGKKGLSAFSDDFKTALAELARARQVLLELMVEDQSAYDALAALRKLPRDSARRQERWTPTLLACIRVPQAMAATGLAILKLCDHLVNIVNQLLLSDLAVCADLAMATTRCALYNVRINAKELTEAADRTAVERTSMDLLARAATVIQHVGPRIWDRDRRGE
jgi:formiminotetrahydrofolate cyclodeaminase